MKGNMTKILLLFVLGVFVIAQAQDSGLMAGSPENNSTVGNIAKWVFKEIIVPSPLDLLNPYTAVPLADGTLPKKCLTEPLPILLDPMGNPIAPPECLQPQNCPDTTIGPSKGDDGAVIRAPEEGEPGYVSPS
jgi:hypothetical protein